MYIAVSAQTSRSTRTRGRATLTTLTCCWAQTHRSMLTSVLFCSVLCCAVSIRGCNFSAVLIYSLLFYSIHFCFIRSCYATACHVMDGFSFHAIGTLECAVSPLQAPAHLSSVQVSQPVGQSVNIVVVSATTRDLTACYLVQVQTQFNLWAVMAAPLLIGSRLLDIPPSGNLF